MDRLSLASGQYIEPYVIIGTANATAFSGLTIGCRGYLSSEATTQNVIFIGVGGVREGRRN